MIINLRTRPVLLAAVFAALPTAVLAQDNMVDDQANRVAAEAQELEQAATTLDNRVAEAALASANDAAAYPGSDNYGRDRGGDDDHGKWGLLGLLGLAGLLGLKRRDDALDRDRRTTTTTTGTAGTRTGTRTGTPTGTTGTSGTSGTAGDTDPRL